MPLCQFDRHITCSGLTVGYAAESLRTAMYELPLF